MCQTNIFQTMYYISEMRMQAMEANYVQGMNKNLVKALKWILEVLY